MKDKMTPWEAIRSLSAIFIDETANKNLYLCNLIARTALGMSDHEYTNEVLAQINIEIDWGNDNES